MAHNFHTSRIFCRDTKDIGKTRDVYKRQAVHIYAAKDLTMGEQHVDQGEFLDCTSVPLEELVQMALQGELPDGKTQLAVLKLAELRRRGIF